MSEHHNEPTSRTLGLEALRQRRFKEAIEHFERHLLVEPDDEEASMELGLAELLLGQRTSFVDRYASLCERFSVVAPSTPRARLLWDRCRRMGEGMAAAALMLSAAGIPATSAGCAKTSPDHSPPVTVEVPATPASLQPTVALPTPAEEAATDPEPEASSDIPPPASAPPVAPPPTRDYPKTRYIAVRPNPVPNLTP